MDLTAKEKKLILAGYINGYQRGHDDTVDGYYGDSEESATEWLEASIECGDLEHSINSLKHI